MKKIFTLIFSIALISTAWSQRSNEDWNNQTDGYSKNDNRVYRHNDYGNSGFYYFTPRERDMMIDRINRNYDYKINNVKNQFFMNWIHKKRQIRNLDMQRNYEIQAVNDKFNSRRNRFYDTYHPRRNW